MIEDVHNSNEVDISAHLTPLDAIADGTLLAAVGRQRKNQTWKANLRPTKPAPKEPEPVQSLEDQPPVEEPEPEPLDLAEEFCSRFHGRS